MDLTAHSLPTASSTPDPHLKCPAILMLLSSHAFECIMMHLDYEQVFTMQVLNKKCYEFTIPRFLKRDDATVRP